MAYLSVGLAVAAAVGVTAAADAFLSAADALTLQVAVALAHMPPPETPGGLNLIHICFVPSDLIRGQQIVLLALLAGGVPAAFVAAGLEAGVKRPWRGTWATAFLAGFVFQVNSLAFTTLLFVLLALPAMLFAPIPTAALTASGFLLAITGNIWGLRSWRALQMTARETPLRVTPV